MSLGVPYGKGVPQNFSFPWYLHRIFSLKKNEETKSGIRFHLEKLKTGHFLVCLPEMGEIKQCVQDERFPELLWKGAYNREIFSPLRSGQNELGGSIYSIFRMTFKHHSLLLSVYSSIHPSIQQLQHSVTYNIITWWNMDSALIMNLCNRQNKNIHERYILIKQIYFNLKVKSVIIKL